MFKGDTRVYGVPGTGARIHYLLSLCQIPVFFFFFWVVFFLQTDSLKYNLRSCYIYRLMPFSLRVFFKSSFHFHIFLFFLSFPCIKSVHEFHQMSDHYSISFLSQLVCLLERREMKFSLFLVFNLSIFPSFFHFTFSISISFYFFHLSFLFFFVFCLTQSDRCSINRGKCNILLSNIFFIFSFLAV